jgi:hypothetical protein
VATTRDDIRTGGTGTANTVSGNTYTKSNPAGAG